MFIVSATLAQLGGKYNFVAAKKKGHANVHSERQTEVQLQLL